MTNLDSIFKSKDITLATKVHLVKGMVFPAVMYGCESWTMKKEMGIPDTNQFKGQDTFHLYDYSSSLD